MHGTLPYATDEEIENRVTARIARQALLDREDPPKLWAIIDEAAARRLVGGREVMRVQLEKLNEAAARPSVTLQVIPFDAGPHPGMDGAFVVLEFPEFSVWKQYVYRIASGISRRASAAVMLGSTSSTAAIFSLRRSSPLSLFSKPSSQPPYPILLHHCLHVLGYFFLRFAQSADCIGGAGWIGRTVDCCPLSSGPASLEIGPHFQEARHLVPVASLIGPVGLQSARRSLHRARPREDAAGTGAVGPLGSSHVPGIPRSQVEEGKEG